MVSENSTYERNFLRMCLSLQYISFLRISDNGVKFRLQENFLFLFLLLGIHFNIRSSCSAIYV